MLTGGFISADPKSKKAKDTDKGTSLANTADVLKKIEELEKRGDGEKSDEENEEKEGSKEKSKEGDDDDDDNEDAAEEEYDEEEQEEVKVYWGRVTVTNHKDCLISNQMYGM
ncbi:Hypothetical predicted protein [Marmota monax]|uniref:Uncharacterized protein n=1 Tax=Marmota monax TaxID=9995 RepID=A0A5E4D3F6_MARMO|nr:hypothetical protein GHT09_019216 [Marmota monax]VTJ87721.1 Hypothetical predicted protein [Marmota monax]